MTDWAYDGKSSLTVRISEINYGNHLGHDRLITFIHQARLDFLAQLGGDEMDLYGASLIMRRLSVDYLAEAFLDDEITVYMRIGVVKATRFAIDYRLMREDTLIAEVSTLLVTFDYQARKVVELPAALRRKFDQLIAER